MSIHPIIKEYSETEKPLLEIVEKHYQKDNYLEDILFKLVKDEKKLNLDINLFEEIDQAVNRGHPNSELYLFFILISINYSIKKKEFKKANTLTSIASSLLTEETTTLVQVLYFQVLADIKYYEGKGQECKKYYLKSISLITKNQPRTNHFKLNCMTSFGGMAELTELGLFTEEIPDSFKDEKYMQRYLMAVLFNCIMTGNYQLGFKVINKMRKNISKENYFRIDGGESVLKIISGNFNENSYLDNFFKLYANVCFYFSTGDLEEARRQFNSFLNEKSNIDFVGGFSLHFELSSKNIGKARHILLEDEQKGVTHYLNDLYYGRLHLLEKNYSAADQTFRRLSENVKKYGAYHRLAFELNFAKEMRLLDIMRLLNGWEANPIDLPSKEEIKKVVNQTKIYKGAELLIGESSNIRQIKDQIKKYAKLKDIVLITGETGTGKELVAQAIHEEGANPKEQFLAINCGALTDTLLQSELFGYVAGAFTGAQKERKGIFESAGSGTVFLDEFGDISPKLQVSLLRVLESNEIRLLGDTVTRKIHCKIIIATNVNLRQAVAENKFREDLFFRLARFEIKLSGLRERIKDLAELIQYFLDKNNGFNENRKTITNELLNALSEYQWPGNIRELKNEIDRLYILNPGIDLLNVEHFDFTHLQGKPFQSKNLPLSNSANTTSQPTSIKEDPHAQIIQSGFRIEKRYELLKELFKKHKKLTRRQIVEIIKVGQTTATKDLQKLCDSGFIVRRSPTKSLSTDYFEIV